MHMSEPDCKVKEALENGEISRSRYENYCLLVQELKTKSATEVRRDYEVYFITVHIIGGF